MFGEGEHTTSDGEVYKGTFKHEKEPGDGISIDSDSSSYEEHLAFRKTNCSLSDKEAT